MAEEHSFEKSWLEKFGRCLDEVAGARIRERVMGGQDRLSSGPSTREVIDWTKQAVERLDGLVPERDRREILTGCACQYSESELAPIRKTYRATRDTKAAHQMLQEQFASFLRETLRVDQALAEEVIARGWGAAGVMQDNTIVATKIPKSESLLQYMHEQDPDRKREYYCRCPRVRDILKTGETLSPTYCYCGAGFYKGICEEILQEPVEVELQASVLAGDEVCRVLIHLPN